MHKGGGGEGGEGERGKEWKFFIKHEKGHPPIFWQPQGPPSKEFGKNPRAPPPLDVQLLCIYAQETCQKAKVYLSEFWHKLEVKENQHLIQWVPPNRITDNVINWIILSD